MITAVAQRTSCLEWSVASRALPGQPNSGDLHLVTPWNGGVLLAVADGLGHGDDAATAARMAMKVLSEHAGESVITLVQHCHRALQSTRGVALTVMAIEPAEARVVALGIGNVEAMMFRANPRAEPRRQSVLLRGGVVGYQLPALHASVWPLGANDVFVFVTDGLRDDFGDGFNPAEPMPQVVERIMAQKFRGTDDGLVLAAKYLGQS